ncbi:hypothetical protein EDI_261060 [Entamoeba dispar SAW760]|uniref:Uncharacterized protein n=1 Tax=Entamoeba dispar (strain ATCC PRA-260 / SAW760) TaxID=370354 RepID=B0E878_ENTDS|nr:uncharacterized protein EDI_261060 [Entamoeba dispar SAW760]EDR29267.1 hypothetical protein EDI_261060 [Entamoeba dispar SAW760]|eukprot:EDR29267.1 hypothetical protein EDI_261060 [Entamoeba dispar SAW760]
MLFNNKKQNKQLIVNNFHVENDNERNDFKKKLNECVDLFDSNEYPNQLIFTKNGGYSSQLSYIVEKMISPYDDTNYIRSVRISDFTEDRMKIDYSNVCTTNKCELRKMSVNKTTWRMVFKSKYY